MMESQQAGQVYGRFSRKATGNAKQQAIHFQSCKALILFDPGVILLQEIQPKKPTYQIKKNAGSIKRMKVAFYGKNNIKELGKDRNYTML